ncbi:MAG: hypothetical protein ACRC1P_06035 [Cellulosilyticaceae bacterium]
MLNCAKAISNKKLILIVVVGALLLGEYIDDEDQELIGNLLLIVGQILITLAL